MSTRATLIYKDLIVPKPLSHLYVKYVVAPEGKIPNNIVFVCKAHCLDCLIKELVIDNSLDNPTYTPTTFTKEGILDNQDMFCIPLEFQLNIKSLIFRHST